jgi:hypothetical protein
MKKADGKTSRTSGLRSFRELYIQFTGDQRVTGRVEEATRLSESLNSGSFTKVLGDSITRRLVQEYAMPEFAVWRDRIATVVPLNDFRTQHRMRFGGYANFPTVAEGAPYVAMTSPTDEEATYAPAKRGGTESVTLEMIKNDDVGTIKRIPVRLGRAAGQTLYEFVFDFMRTNAAVYDSTALAAAGHGSNIITTALSASNVQSARLKMRQQTDMSNGKRLGLKARFLWVPSDLEDLAFQICGADKAVPDSSLAAQAAPAADNPVKRAGIVPITVDYWTDANDYWVTASPDQCPMVEVGFLDGREDPELFVQDQPNVGSLFSNDAITWKLRHIYGGGRRRLPRVRRRHRSVSGDDVGLNAGLRRTPPAPLTLRLLFREVQQHVETCNQHRGRPAAAVPCRVDRVRHAVGRLRGTDPEAPHAPEGAHRRRHTQRRPARRHARHEHARHPERRHEHPGGPLQRGDADARHAGRQGRRGARGRGRCRRREGRGAQHHHGAGRRHVADLGRRDGADRLHPARRLSVARDRKYRPLDFCYGCARVDGR